MRSNRGAALGEIEARLRRLNEAGAITVENNVKGRTPVDTGRLRSSIAHDSDAGGFVVGTNVSYSRFVEFGTRYQSPQPYLVPGLVRSIGELRRIYGGG